MKFLKKHKVLITITLIIIASLTYYFRHTPSTPITALPITAQPEHTDLTPPPTPEMQKTLIPTPNLTPLGITWFRNAPHIITSTGVQTPIDNELIWQTPITRILTTSASHFIFEHSQRYYLATPTSILTDLPLTSFNELSLNQSGTIVCERGESVQIHIFQNNTITTSTLPEIDKAAQCLATKTGVAIQTENNQIIFSSNNQTFSTINILPEEKLLTFLEPNTAITSYHGVLNFRTPETINSIAFHQDSTLTPIFTLNNNLFIVERYSYAGGYSFSIWKINDDNKLIVNNLYGLSRPINLQSLSTFQPNNDIIPFLTADQEVWISSISQSGFPTITTSGISFINNLPIQFMFED